MTAAQTRLAKSTSTASSTVRYSSSSSVAAILLLLVGAACRVSRGSAFLTSTPAAAAAAALAGRYFTSSTCLRTTTGSHSRLSLTTMAAEGAKFSARWCGTCLKIKDPTVSVPFYQNNFGMDLISKEDVGGGVTEYHLATLRDGETVENMKPEHTTVLQLSHKQGVENTDVKYANGNVEPHRGFGHIAFMVDDVYDASDKLDKAGVKFQKKPDDGRMKGLAFVIDPDGYWIEILARAPNSGYSKYYNLAQTMMRIKDPAKSMVFYGDVMGVKKLHEWHFQEAAFSLFFMQSPTSSTPTLGTEGAELPDPTTPESKEFIGKLWSPILELTHNHGTEKDDGFKYYNGHGTEEGAPEGFSYITFNVDGGDDCVAAAVDAAVKSGCGAEELKDESGKVIFGLKDPDGYWVKLKKGK